MAANKPPSDSNWYGEWYIGSKTGMGRGPGGAMGNSEFYFPKVESSFQPPDHTRSRERYLDPLTPARPRQGLFDGFFELAASVRDALPPLRELYRAGHWLWNRSWQWRIPPTLLLALTLPLAVQLGAFAELDGDYLRTAVTAPWWTHACAGALLGWAAISIAAFAVLLVTGLLAIIATLALIAVPLAVVYVVFAIASGWPLPFGR